MVALVIAFAVAGVVAVAHESSIARRGADFTIDYAAAQLIREGHPDAIYDPSRLGPLMLQLSDGAIDPRLPFDAPLVVALPYLPLTFFPLELAFHLWQAITLSLASLALLLLARWIPIGRRAPAIGILALLGSPAMWSLLSEGQSSALLLVGAALVLGAWRRGSVLPAAAGALLLAIKPQYVPVYLILIVSARYWRAAGAALLGCLVVGLSPLLAGVHGLSAMIWSALDSGQGVILYNESLIATLAPLLPGRPATIASFVLWGLVLTGLIGIAIWRPQRAASHQEATITPMAIVATSAGLIFAPHALPYDMVLLAVPMWLAFALHRQGEIPTPAPAGFVVAATMVVDLGRPFVNLAPVVMLVCLAIYGWIWFRRRAEQPAPARQVA